MNKIVRTLGCGFSLALAAGSAAAHPGHEHGLLAGLAHPIAGADHLLAMVAVGVWSAAALPAARRWAGPAAFVAAMLAGAVAGAAGLTIAGVETGIAASVVLLGLMLAAVGRAPASLGLALVAVAASLHGLAHGAELPAGASFAAYAAGFVASTTALHLGGLAIGRQLLRAKAWVWRASGALVGSAGLLMLARV